MELLLELSTNSASCHLRAQPGHLREHDAYVPKAHKPPCQIGSGHPAKIIKENNHGKICPLEKSYSKHPSGIGVGHALKR